MRVLVAGAGAVGSTVALQLQSEGAKVVIADPAGLGDNASGVAAGMLAPASEAVFDEVSTGRFEVLAAARDLWPGFAERLEEFGACLDRSGALWVGEEASQARVLARLSGAGAKAYRVSAAEAGRLSHGLNAPQGAVFTPEDWRIAPGALLMAMRTAFLAGGGELRRSGLRRWDQGRVEFSDGEVLTVDAVILATGLAPDGLATALPELETLSPIKGQIVRLGSEAPMTGPVVRANGIYVSPCRSGALAGATMQPGVRDRGVEPEAVRKLHRAAAELFPDLAEAPATGAAGVRAATPDGLPLVGASSLAGVSLALGARRNGWLLAPLAAEMLADQLAGVPPGPFAAPFDPRRFGR